MFATPQPPTDTVTLTRMRDALAAERPAVELLLDEARRIALSKPAPTLDELEEWRSLRVELELIDNTLDLLATLVPAAENTDSPEPHAA